MINSPPLVLTKQYNSCHLLWMRDEVETVTGLFHHMNTHVATNFNMPSTRIVHGLEDRYSPVSI